MQSVKMEEGHALFYVLFKSGMIKNTILEHKSFHFLKKVPMAMGDQTRHCHLIKYKSQLVPL